ncbi:hypothetical protein [Streptomyces alfalfae]
MFSFFRRAAKITAPAPIAETASVSETQPLICPFFGIPYGDPGSVERTNYILAQEEYDAEQERQLFADLAAIRARRAD